MWSGGGCGRWLLLLATSLNISAVWMTSWHHCSEISSYFIQEPGGSFLLPYFISIRFNSLYLKCHYFNKQETLIHYWCQKCTREVPAEVRSPAFLHCRSLLWCHQTVATAWWQCSHSQSPGALLFPGWILNVVTFKKFSFLALLQYIATFNRIILNPFSPVLQSRNASGLPLV